MDEKELKQLAIDIAENKVFGTFHMNENEMNSLQVVFMPFIALSEERRKKMRDDNVIHVYEYYDKAGPRSVNGMPCFFSFSEIIEKDWKKVVKYIKEYEVKKNSFLNKKEIGQETIDEPMLFKE